MTETLMPTETRPLGSVMNQEMLRSVEEPSGAGFSLRGTLVPLLLGRAEARRRLKPDPLVVAAPLSSAPRIAEFLERISAGGLLLALLPLMTVLAIAVFLLSGRAPLIAHRRVGRYGRDLWVWKFRTMWGERMPYRAQLTDYIADEDGPSRKSPGDSRVRSAFAAFCRRHSLDELPQLWNVLAGEMSLVGPRPVTRTEVHEVFGEAAAEIQQVKPGLTGLWQVSGRNRLTPVERRALDLQMAQMRSPKVYMAILLRTVPELVGGNNSW